MLRSKQPVLRPYLSSPAAQGVPKLLVVSYRSVGLLDWTGVSWSWTVQWNVPCAAMRNRINIGKTSKGSQRYFCPSWQPTNTLHLWYPLLPPSRSAKKMCQLYCFSHAEGSSLRGSSRSSGFSYDTVASIVQAASQKAQIVHNAEV
jgi:transposase-like protein